VPAVLAGLGIVKRLGDNRVAIKILKVSGTIKGLGKKR
jgi:RNase P/RNase MRP subunit POP5